MKANHPDWSDGPRERLQAQGVNSLSDADLLAILISTGTASASCETVARDMLRRGRNLRDLAARSVKELAGLEGLGAAKACRILAAAEFGRRLLRDEVRGAPLNSADLVHAACRDLATRREEVFAVLVVDSRNRLRGRFILAQGWESGVNLTPRQVLSFLLKEGATRVVCVHNHPSGDPLPSAEDVAFTRRLLEAMALVDIRALDHVIVAGTGFCSMRERNTGGLAFG